MRCNRFVWFGTAAILACSSLPENNVCAERQFYGQEQQKAEWESEEDLQVTPETGSVWDVSEDESGDSHSEIPVTTTMIPEPEDSQTDAWNYQQLEDGTLEITGYIGTETELVIPSKIDGKEVSSIGWYTFSNCDSLTAIEFPKKLRRIGGAAFAGCNGLEEILLPEGMEYIEDSAFAGCSNLQNITVEDSNSDYMSQDGVLYSKDGGELICCPGGKTDCLEVPEGVSSIGSWAFFRCKELTNIILPKSVVRIGDYAFSECRNLCDITFAEGLANIGDYAFEGCSSLRKLLLPESVHSIGIGAFCYCSSLTDVNFSKNVSSIGERAFSYCDSLLHIVADRENPVYLSEDGILYDKDKLTVICCPGGKTGRVTVPEGIWYIGNHAFSGCNSLRQVILPQGVTVIEDWAFSGCSNLISVELPESVVEIGNVAFSGCSSLKEFELPDGVQVVGDYAFSGCSSLEDMIRDND